MNALLQNSGSVQWYLCSYQHTLEKCTDIQHVRFSVSPPCTNILGGYGKLNLLVHYCNGELLVYLGITSSEASISKLCER